MTIQVLLGYTAEQLEAMSDKDLTLLLEPHFNVTRPNPAMFGKNGNVLKKAKGKASDDLANTRLANLLKMNAELLAGK